MGSLKKIPPYHDRTNQKFEQKNVVAEEIHRQDKLLKAAKRKNRKLKGRCADQKARRKSAERRLEQERADASKREQHIKIQTKLNDLVFYRGGRI